MEDDNPQKVDLPLSINNFIETKVTKYQRSLRDYLNPDGSKPSDDELIKMTKDQFRDFAKNYLELGDSEEATLKIIEELIELNESEE